MPLMDLVRRSDVIVLCAADTAKSRHVIDRRAIAAMRKGCVLVNVGRSMLIDMPALVRRLRRDDMVAMLDVFDREPLEKRSPLRRLRNAYLTPHRAGGLLASVQRAFVMLTDDLEACLKGRRRTLAITRAMASRIPDSG